jgi:glutamyl-tRNA synthetase
MSKTKQAVRTRFAPSPTGFLHVGAARTALFAWLLARQQNGSFILRIEDTDKKRQIEGAEEHIIKTLRALGLDYDEGPDSDAEHGPYRQSERLDTYQQWAQTLVASGRAYADPYTSEEVADFREQAQAKRQPFLFRNHRPDSPPEWDGSMPLRFKSEPKSYEWHDEVMGDLSTGPEVIDDFVIMKSDGFPTYNFAHIIDDHEMSITHIIRGQEFIASVPNYLNLYEALDLPVPVMATMPPILGPDGKKKLSKRDGAKDLLEYLDDGYLPEALISFIATLGWNDGTTQEIFTTEELIKRFSLAGVGKGGATFDEARLRWVNGHFIRNLSVDEVYEKAKSYLPEEASSKDEQYNKSVIACLQERLKYLSEIPELSMFFYKDLPIDLSLINDHKKLKKYDAEQLISLLKVSRETICDVEVFTAGNITAALNQLLTDTEEKPVVLFSLIRIAITQAPASPALADTIAVLGKDTVSKRIDEQISALKS